MTEEVGGCKYYYQGYRITRTVNGLRIVTVSYHATPLELDHDELASFGLQPRNAGARPHARPSRPRRSAVMGLRDNLENTIEMLLLPDGQGVRERAVENLLRARALLNHLDDGQAAPRSHPRRSRHEPGAREPRTDLSRAS
jgi:hypothetical protein